MGACSHSRRVDWIEDEAGRQTRDQGEWMGANAEAPAG